MAMASEAGVSASVDTQLDELPPAAGGTPPRPSPRELPYRVVSSKVRLGVRVREIWESRELFVFLVRKELKVKYKSSVLGLLWSMLNPAVVLMVYYVVFKYVLKNPTPDFALYLFSGLLVWNLFATVLPGSSSTIVANAGIVKKVAFPREILPLSQVGTGVVFLFFQMIVMALFLLGFQYSPDWSYLPVALFALVDLIVLTAAFAIFLSAVNVYYRDVEHLVAVLLQAWFWGIPVVYNFNLVYTELVKLHSFHWLMDLYLIDPVTPLVLAFQRAFYGHVDVAVPSQAHYQVLAGYSAGFYLEMLLAVLVAGVLLLVGAMKVFGRIEGNFAEEL
ncbi:MAG TPA: ABC transporter permease [Acidimicrobiales bacterium]|nr:ABC transporter permease [Acidimicrobiales bacterium]